MIFPESDEFHLYGEVQGTDFVPIIDVKNLSTTAFNTKQDACTQINVTINYDYFGAIEEEFTIEYNFEQTDIDVIVKTIRKLTKPDSGKNNNITDTFFLPFVEHSGNAEVFVEIFNKDDIIVGFGDTEPHNTFNITADLSDGCRYRDNPNQFLQARQARALEGINSSAGTFDFSISAADTTGGSTVVQGAGLTGEGNTLNRDVQIQCWTVGYKASTLKTFETYVTNTFSFTESVDVPSDLGTYTMRCLSVDRYFGEDATPATDTFSKSAASVAGQGAALSSEKTKRLTKKLFDMAKASPLLTLIIAFILLSLLITKKETERLKKSGKLKEDEEPLKEQNG